MTTIGLSQIAAAQFLHVYKQRNWINCGQAGPLGWTIPAALGVRAADPARRIVALSGDYDFQFMIEELAVGAQFNIPYIHVLVNNAYLGLIRQPQRVFDMDYCVRLSFDNLNAPEVDGYGLIGMVRQLPRDRGGTLPAVALTAFAQPSDRTKWHRPSLRRHWAAALVTTKSQIAEVHC